MHGGCYLSGTKKGHFWPYRPTHFLKANLKEILERLLWGHYLTFLFQHHHYQMNSKFFPVLKVGKSLHSILECASADFAHDNSCCPPLPVSRSSVSEVWTISVLLLRLCIIMLLGILGACMFYADGMITPAISVLSAVEGLEVAAPALHSMIIPITLFVITWSKYSESRSSWSPSP